jgi:hypothetical protein
MVLIVLTLLILLMFTCFYYFYAFDVILILNSFQDTSERNGRFDYNKDS